MIPNDSENGLTKNQNLQDLSKIQELTNAPFRFFKKQRRRRDNLEIEWDGNNLENS